MTPERVSWSWVGMGAAIVVAMVGMDLALMAAEFAATGSVFGAHYLFQAPWRYVSGYLTFAGIALAFLLVSWLVANLTRSPTKAFLWLAPGLPAAFLVVARGLPWLAELFQPLSSAPPFAGMDGGDLAEDIVSVIGTALGYYAAALVFLWIVRRVRRPA